MSTRRLSQFKKDYKRFKQWIKLDFIPAYKIFPEFYLCFSIQDYRRVLVKNRSIPFTSLRKQSRNLNFLEALIDKTLQEHYWETYETIGESATFDPYLESKIKYIDSPRAKRIAWMFSIIYE